ncbi:CoA-binding protein [Candidatus Lokiarchaeum ossiferum]|uniref:CoA-binding protein n=1 Tax=Candidatus Lokiarchaeum ossiferum TaxID=2951803 RepID=UPI00352CD17E
MTTSSKTFDQHHEDFTALFYPKSIAIIGASKNKLGGSKFLIALQSSGYIEGGGNVYLINPKFDELFGFPVYPDLMDSRIPKPIDLAIIAVSAKFVPTVVKQCNEICRFAVIYTSGFGESGNKNLDTELKNAIASSNTRFIGPNGLGVLNPYSKLAIYPNWCQSKGNISWVAQSGGTMARLYLTLGPMNIGFHNVVSIGNAYDISITDLLTYFQHDSITKTIALYLESIPDGREFMQIAQSITPSKPIILWKGGQSNRGVQATLSHTGGLAGSYNVWKAMCKQSGIMLTDHFEFFQDLVKVAALRTNVPQNLNVAILVAGGGIGVEFTDMFEKMGLVIPDFEPKTIEGLQQIFPAVNTSFNNPIDLGEYGYDPRLFAQAFKLVLADKNIGSVVFVREPERFNIISKMLDIDDAGQMTIDSLTKIIQTTDKPVFCNPSPNRNTVDAYETRYNFQLQMIKAKIPVIEIPTNIPKIILQLYNYGKFLESRK